MNMFPLVGDCRSSLSPSDRQCFARFHSKRKPVCFFVWRSHQRHRRRRPTLAGYSSRQEAGGVRRDPISVMLSLFVFPTRADEKKHAAIAQKKRLVCRQPKPFQDPRDLLSFRIQICEIDKPSPSRLVVEPSRLVVDTSKAWIWLRKAWLIDETFRGQRPLRVWSGSRFAWCEAWSQWSRLGASGVMHWQALGGVGGCSPGNLGSLAQHRLADFLFPHTRIQFDVRLWFWKLKLSMVMHDDVNFVDGACAV
ncbi:hypothetical protein B0T09DRAFT_75476 [Sordaria sp. MPI-SDFR-AT-0083]|nr:hypothetical protein B0T09DRAFT_75476 [Sordaria sp. MPI-SDFR-AT-0083]